MKTMMATLLLTLFTTTAFAQSVPEFSLNDEQFRQVISEGLEGSPYLQDGAAVNAHASYNNRICSLSLQIKSPNMSMNSSYSRTTKNIKKCQKKLLKYLKKELGRF